MKIKNIKKAEKKSDDLTTNDKAKIFDIVTNESLTRSNLLKSLLDPRRNINSECGYPDAITTADYKIMYDREGIATRVVSIFPEESWAEDPMVMEDDDPTKETPFEEAWITLERERQLYSYMYRVDELSGIGRFGILLLGLGDGNELDKPVDGINDKGESTNKTGEENKLLYLRALDESSVKIKTTEKDRTNPRYGMPTLYSILFEDTTVEGTISAGKEVNVHWTRVIHIADNRKNSELYGVPRMQTLFNRLYDLRKICGGSGEMFWKGGFPGYAFEMDPSITAPAAGSTEETAMRTQIADYSNGLQRYLTLQGVSVNSLEPQVAEPKAHVEVQLEIIAIAMGVPKRIFMGAEQAKLASEQDKGSWNKRIKRRQNKYLTPYVVRTVIDRMIAVGILPEVEQYEVKWADLNAPSDKDKAEVLKIVAEALAKYVGGNVDQLIPPEIFFKMFMGLDADEIKEIMDQALQRAKDKEFEDEQNDLNQDDEDEREDEDE